MSDTPTPLTDAEVHTRIAEVMSAELPISPQELVPADFARSLERQIPRWLPIESAPRDGTHVLLMGDYYGYENEGPKLAIGYFNECNLPKKGEKDWIVYFQRFHATAWQPLPTL